MGSFTTAKFELLNKRFKEHRIWCKYLLISLTVLWLSIGIADSLGYILHKDIFIKNAWLLVNILGVFVTAFIFLCFVTMPTFYNKWINKIAAATLGIYLIHDNPMIREIIWNKIYPNTDYFISDSFLLVLIIKTIIVYIICLLAEWIRLRFLI